jgi:hypothetical protein
VYPLPHSGTGELSLRAMEFTVVTSLSLLLLKTFLSLGVSPRAFKQEAEINHMN